VIILRGCSLELILSQPGTLLSDSELPQYRNKYHSKLVVPIEPVSGFELVVKASSIINSLTVRCKVILPILFSSRHQVGLALPQALSLNFIHHAAFQKQPCLYPA
jgi:hypothetical protein